MADFSNNTITVAGRGLIADALARSLKVQFLRIELGDDDVPEALERVVQLGRKVIEFPVSMVSQPTEGACIVTGMFKENTILEGFFAREIGVFARVEGGEDVLLAYAHAGDRADYIPAGSSNSLIEEVFNLTILIGAADVISQDFNANDKATIQFVLEQIEMLNVEEIKSDIEQATSDLKKLADELKETSGGLVKKSGDVMTGTLEVPRVKGSSDEWNGWKIFTGFDELNAADGVKAAVGFGSSVIEIFGKMGVKSRLICDVVVANNFLPGMGTVDFQKILDDVVLADFMALDGSLWRGCFRSGIWSGWREVATVPTGSVVPYGGSASSPAPLGFIFAHGQYLKRSEFLGLFAVFGTQYGSTDSTNFKVPDLRGNVIRGLDNGRRKDSEPHRLLGSEQGDAMRNITGAIGGITTRGLWANGAWSAWDEGGDNVTGVGGGWRRQAANMNLEGTGLPLSSEIRMKNIALNHIIKI